MTIHSSRQTIPSFLQIGSMILSAGYKNVFSCSQPDEPACSCVDCEASCPVPPPEPPLPQPFTIVGIDGFTVVMFLVWLIGTLLFLISVFCCCDNQNSIGKIILFHEFIPLLTKLLYHLMSVTNCSNFTFPFYKQDDR